MTTAWRHLRYERGPDGEDVNEAARGEVLLLESTREDLPLLRFLVEQEALCRGNSQGLGEQAALAGFLLAEHRRPEDVWRHFALKRANFDAGCAYDVEHLLAAGVEATVSHVRASDHPDRDAVLELLDLNIDEDDLLEWFEHRRAWFEV
ncbi:hypothetical protein [Lentzea sp. NEAU-D7]|uniref:hypothetical protein n=1 Tax=Lentzea sp. NEAU-D7 TaxID=2994667 RepID=UPI00224A4F1A|nr:hypothetical protein [Lentzea sp. NEAU-D7]MCX2947760.1 hypothetical protein [Lentzea sp. NEAU-D7]